MIEICDEGHIMCASKENTCITHNLEYTDEIAQNPEKHV